MIKKSLTFSGIVNQDGQFIPDSPAFVKKLKSRFKNKKVSASFSEYEPLMQDAARGYFFAVVMPHYMYGLINAGNDLTLGNRQHEDMVRHELMERHLQNGPTWKINSETVISGPRAFESIIVQVSVRDKIKKGDGVVKLRANKEGSKVMTWKSTAEGRLNLEVSEGDVIPANARLGVVVGEIERSGPSSLSTATQKQAWDFIKRVRKEAQEYLNHVIPDPDVNHNGSVRKELSERLKESRGFVICASCGKPFDAEGLDVENCIDCVIN